MQIHTRIRRELNSSGEFSEWVKDAPPLPKKGRKVTYLTEIVRESRPPPLPKDSCPPPMIKKGQEGHLTEMVPEGVSPCVGVSDEVTLPAVVF